MANTIRGKIEAIEPIQQIASKNGGNPYLTRRLLLDATRFDGLTGERGRENHIMLEFGGDKDVHVPDAFKAGDVVEISFRLDGIKYKKEGETKSSYFVHVRGYKIEYVSNHATDNAQNGGAAAPQNNTASAPSVNANGGNKPQQASDDLPFD
jgi:hypothetical protein